MHYYSRELDLDEEESALESAAALSDLAIIEEARRIEQGREDQAVGPELAPSNYIGYQTYIV